MSTPRTPATPPRFARTDPSRDAEVQSANPGMIAVKVVDLIPGRAVRAADGTRYTSDATGAVRVVGGRQRKSKKERRAIARTARAVRNERKQSSEPGASFF